MKVRLLNTEESQIKTKELFDYISKFRKGIVKIAKEKKIDLSANKLEYELDQTPITSANNFLYDRTKFNIDAELNEFLSDLNKE